MKKTRFVLPVEVNAGEKVKEEAKLNSSVRFVESGSRLTIPVS